VTRLEKSLCRFKCVKDDTQTLNVVTLTLKDKPRSGQSVDDSFQDKVTANPRISTEEIAKSLNINSIAD